MFEMKDWIPCSLNLPDVHQTFDIFKRPYNFVSDPVLVTVKSTECNGVHYYVGSDLLIGKSKDDADWLMSCGYGGSAVIKQEIIAWMPNPEPYKEERE